MEFVYTFVCIVFYSFSDCLDCIPWKTLPGFSTELEGYRITDQRWLANIVKSIENPWTTVIRDISIELTLTNPGEDGFQLVLSPDTKEVGYPNVNEGYHCVLKDSRGFDTAGFYENKSIIGIQCLYSVLGNARIPWNFNDVQDNQTIGITALRLEFDDYTRQYFIFRKSPSFPPRSTVPDLSNLRIELFSLEPLVMDSSWIRIQDIRRLFALPFR